MKNKSQKNLDRFNVLRQDNDFLYLPRYSKDFYLHHLLFMKNYIFEISGYFLKSIINLNDLKASQKPHELSKNHIIYPDESLNFYINTKYIDTMQILSLPDVKLIIGGHADDYIRGVQAEQMSVITSLYEQVKISDGLPQPKASKPGKKI